MKEFMKRLVINKVDGTEFSNPPLTKLIFGIKKFKERSVVWLECIV